MFLNFVFCLLITLLVRANKYCQINKDTFYLQESDSVILRDTSLIRNLSTRSKCLENLTYLKNFLVTGNKNKLLETDIDLDHLIDFYQSINKTNKISIIFSKIKGVSVVSKTKKQKFGKNRDLIFYLYQSELNFLQNHVKIECSDERSKNFEIFSFLNKYQYEFFFIIKFLNNLKLCSYLFNNVSIFSFGISPFIDTFYSKKMVSFSNDNETNINSKINGLFIFYAVKIKLDHNILNPQIFKFLTNFRVIGSIDFIQNDLFVKLNFLKYFILDGQNFNQLIQKSGTQWFKSINSNVKVNINNFTQIIENFQSSVYISISFNFPDYVDYSYIEPLINIETTFPEEDFCLYQDFPFDQMVFFLIDQINFDDMFKTCTQFWLTYRIQIIQYYNIYKENFEKYLNHTKLYYYLANCNFNQKLVNCNFESLKRIIVPSAIGVTYYTLIIAFFLNFIIIPISCLISLMLNALTIIISKKYKAKIKYRFHKQIYFINLHAFYNCLICLIEGIKILLEIIIKYEVYQSIYAQYFKIVFHEFLLNVFKFNSNYSFIVFLCLRCQIINFEETKFFNFIKHKQTHKIIQTGIIIGVVLCLVKLFSFEINHYDLFQEFPIHLSYSSVLKKTYYIGILIDIFTLLMHFVNTFGFLVFSLIIEIIMIKNLCINLKKRNRLLKLLKMKNKYSNSVHLKMFVMIIINLSLNLFLRTPEIFSIFYLNRKSLMLLFQNSHSKIFKYLYYLNRSSILEIVEKIQLFLYMMSLSLSFFMLYFFNTFFKSNVKIFFTLKNLNLFKNIKILFK